VRGTFRKDLTLASGPEFRLTRRVSARVFSALLALAAVGWGVFDIWAGYRVVGAATALLAIAFVVQFVQLERAGWRFDGAVLRSRSVRVPVGDIEGVHMAFFRADCARLDRDPAWRAGSPGGRRRARGATHRGPAFRHASARFHAARGEPQLSCTPVPGLALLLAAAAAAPHFRLQALAVEGDVASVVAADLDGDGRKDLVAVYKIGVPPYQKRSFAIFWNRDGVFAPRPDLTLAVDEAEACAFDWAPSVRGPLKTCSW